MSEHEFGDDVPERQQAQRHMDELFRALVENALDVITILDAEGVIRYQTPSGERVLGYKPAELIGVNIVELLHPDDAPKVNVAIKAAASPNGTPEIAQVVEARLRHKDGSWRILEAIGKALPGGMPVTGIVFNSRDITERKRAEEGLRENEERYRTSVENMLDAFGIYSAIRDESGGIVDFQVEFVNAAACALNRMTREEQIGKRLLELLPAHRESGLFDVYCQVVETGSPFVTETLVYEDVYGTQRLSRDFDIRAAKLGDGFVAAWRDVTERMRRGRQAKLQAGILLPWTRAPYGYILDPERPRDPSRVRIDPVKANIIRQIFAWYTDPETPVSLHWVGKQLNEQQIPPPRGGKCWNPSTIRGILRSPSYTGTAYSGRTRSVPARQRKSALLPVGRGESTQPTPPNEWIAVSVPAILTQEIFKAAQARLEKNQNMAQRNNKSHAYLLRGLVSCGQCRLSSTGRSQGKYHYYTCRGRTDVHRAAKGERCIARYVPSQELDDLVWQDLCCIVADPDLITHALERVQAGEWLPQALQAKRNTVRQTLVRLERQQERLLEVYLAEIIMRDEFERKRQELSQTQNGLQQQLRQLELQAQKQIETLPLANNIQEFCQSIQPTLSNLNFDQRRQLVELLIDRVIVDDEKVEIRYVIPTSPNGEKTRFCHLRTDYLNPVMHFIDSIGLLPQRKARNQAQHFLFAFSPQDRHRQVCETVLLGERDLFPGVKLAAGALDGFIEAPGGLPAASRLVCTR